ncbi:response regulator transcription factor [Nocardia sp. NPDC050175]|uniref:response regulator transcription factor n=1 Tax=Nocardia sp. NPDC050175 TaxID=3364317 RepID=UPI0037AD90F2
MPKKPLKKPALPPGARRDFFDAMQAMVREAGNPPTVKLGQQVGYSHQAVYKALTGPNMPSEQITTVIAHWFGAEEAVATALDLWRRAVAEQQGSARVNSTVDPASLPEKSAEQPTRKPADRSTDTSGTIVPAPPTPYGWRDAGLSAREREVLVAWVHSDSKTQVGRQLYLSIGTVNTHVTRIRSKYAAVGRPANTKAALVARAFQDGLVELDEV